jgi:hypothetical protein
MILLVLVKPRAAATPNPEPDLAEAPRNS